MDRFDLELRQALKSWVAHHPFPTSGRARLLRTAASLNPAEETLEDWLIERPVFPEHYLDYPQRDLSGLFDYGWTIHIRLLSSSRLA